MIQIVMKPDYDAGQESGEGMYKCLFNGEDVGLRVRGRKAAHAEDKMMEIFRSQLKGKVVDYDLEAYRANKGVTEGPKEEKSPQKPATEAPMLPGM